MIIHRIVDGPYVEDSGTWLVCLVEEAGEVFVEDVEFIDMNEAYKFKRDLDCSLEPLELEEWLLE